MINEMHNGRIKVCQCLMKFAMVEHEFCRCKIKVMAEFEVCQCQISLQWKNMRYVSVKCSWQWQSKKYLNVK